MNLHDFLLTVVISRFIQNLLNKNKVIWVVTKMSRLQICIIIFVFLYECGLCNSSLNSTHAIQKRHKSFLVGILCHPDSKILNNINIRYISKFHKKWISPTLINNKKVCHNWLLHHFFQFARSSFTVSKIK